MTLWICPKCRAEVEGTFAACWQCGTDPDGIEDPGFVREEPAHLCHVCGAVGAWEDADGVHVCPGCLAGTTPDPVRRPWYLRSRHFVGRFAGHPVYVEPHLLVLLFVVLQPGGDWWVFAATLLALLAHAFGHAVAARLAGRGREPVSIALADLLDPPDALQQFAGPREPGQRRVAALVTVAGPLGNLLVAGAGWAVARSVPTAALEAIVRVNLLLGLVSLLPMPPLDGGRLVVGALARSHEASCRIHGVFALIAGAVWLGLCGCLFGGHADWRWLPWPLALLPLVVVFCLMCASEPRGAKKWDAARAARDRKANTGRPAARGAG